METVNCDLKIEALIECPNEVCGIIIDLFEMESLTEDGYLYNELLSDAGFGKENFGEIIKCPECGQVFKVGDVTW